MSIVAGAVTVLCASIAVEVVAEQAYSIGLIAAGAAIGLASAPAFAGWSAPRGRAGGSAQLRA